MAEELEAFLDIETTGLSSYCTITVIGIYVVNSQQENFFQLVGDDVLPGKLMDCLDGVDTMYTYNGTGFDLRLIKQLMGVDLARHIPHRDLMFDCWRQELKGGLKAVERQLGIAREVKGVDGYQAVLLWNRYQRYGDKNALATLLAYNKEDVLNLKIVKEKLMEGLCRIPDEQ